VPVSSRALSSRQESRLRVTAARERTRRRVALRAAAEADRRYHLLLAQSQRMQTQLRHVAQQLLAAQEDERRRISQELHDGVVQLLAGVSVQLATLTVSGAQNGRTLKSHIARVQRLVGKSIDAVHRFARDLRPAVLDDLGLLPALRSFIRGLRTPRRFNVRITASSGVENLGKDQRLVLFRVAQEALTNVVRHAHATHAHVRIRRRASAIVLEIADDGVSFDAERVFMTRRHQRLGVLGMRERVEMTGGRFTIESSPGRGTLVRAVIPVGASGEGAV
jgi:two-component system, NarL family, sensor histidine kinase DegS